MKAASGTPGTVPRLNAWISPFLQQPVHAVLPHTSPLSAGEFHLYTPVFLSFLNQTSLDHPFQNYRVPSFTVKLPELFPFIVFIFSFPLRIHNKYALVHTIGLKSVLLQKSMSA